MSNSKSTPEEEEKFQSELYLKTEIRDRYKREALERCAAEHLAYIQCLEKGGTCVKEDKAFWDCYRAQRGYSKTKFDAMMERMNKKWFPNYYKDKQENSSNNSDKKTSS